MSLVSCHSTGKVLLKLSHNLCWILQLLFSPLTGFSLVLMEATEKWADTLLIKLSLPWNTV